LRFIPPSHPSPSNFFIEAMYRRRGRLLDPKIKESRERSSLPRSHLAIAMPDAGLLARRSILFFRLHFVGVGFFIITLPARRSPGWSQSRSTRFSLLASRPDQV
jgi:hypothetical protein